MLKHAYSMKIAQSQTYVWQIKNDKTAIEIVIAGENIHGSLCIRKGLLTFSFSGHLFGIPKLY